MIKNKLIAARKEKNMTQNDMADLLFYKPVAIPTQRTGRNSHF